MTRKVTCVIRMAMRWEATRRVAWFNFNVRNKEMFVIRERNDSLRKWVMIGPSGAWLQRRRMVAHEPFSLNILTRCSL